MLDAYGLSNIGTGTIAFAVRVASQHGWLTSSRGKGPSTGGIWMLPRRKHVVGFPWVFRWFEFRGFNLAREGPTHHVSIGISFFHQSEKSRSGSAIESLRTAGQLQ